MYNKTEDQECMFAIDKMMKLSSMVDNFVYSLNQLTGEFLEPFRQ